MKTSYFYMAAMIMWFFVAGTNTVPCAMGSDLGALSLQVETRQHLNIENKTPAAETMPLDIASPLEVAGLGPQPEPPDCPEFFKNQSEIAGISPQPEPPTLPLVYDNPLNKRLINPQPEPPGDPEAGTPMPIPPSSTLKINNPSEVAGINPQPEPPGEGYLMNLYKGEKAW